MGGSRERQDRLAAIRAVLSGVRGARVTLEGAPTTPGKVTLAMALAGRISKPGDP
jgi:hypothetical protein